MERRAADRADEALALGSMVSLDTTTQKSPFLSYASVRVIVAHSRRPALIFSRGKRWNPVRGRQAETSDGPGFASYMATVLWSMTTSGGLSAGDSTKTRLGSLRRERGARKLMAWRTTPARRRATLCAGEEARGGRTDEGGRGATLGEVSQL